MCFQPGSLTGCAKQTQKPLPSCEDRPQGESLEAVMSITFAIERVPTLPPLAFAAEIAPGRNEVSVRCGTAVEADPQGVTAGAWAGPFAEMAIDRAATSIGTALRRTSHGLIAVVGTASANALFFLRTPAKLVVSNSFAFALARGNDGLLTSYPFYPQDLSSFAFGIDRCRESIPTQAGRLSVGYASTKIDVADLSLSTAAVSRPPPFPSFSAYRAFLVAETETIFANAADPSRRVHYRPTVALSGGYDSPAAAVIAREAGCQQAFTFGQPVDQPDSRDDSGAEIGRALGLHVDEYDTFAYRERKDLPEVEFIAANFGGGQVYLTSLGDRLANGIVVSGYGGDRVWATHYALEQEPMFPFYIGGYSQSEFYLRAPALDLSVPVIGARSFADIGTISRSPEMQQWSIGGDYDRPIPRRLLEDAGLPRGTFAGRKRRVTPDYDSLTRRAVNLDRFLSPFSRAQFEAWFAKFQPIERARAFRHRLLVDSIGRIIWSRKLGNLLNRIGIYWPPLPARLLHLKVHIRKNAFVFNWAMSEQISRYRDLLKSGRVTEN
jgi:hypothetical protein